MDNKHCTSLHMKTYKCPIMSKLIIFSDFIRTKLRQAGLNRCIAPNTSKKHKLISLGTVASIENIIVDLPTVDVHPQPCEPKDSLNWSLSKTSIYLYKDVLYFC